MPALIFEGGGPLGTCAATPIAPSSSDGAPAPPEPHVERAANQAASHCCRRRGPRLGRLQLCRRAGEERQAMKRPAWGAPTSWHACAACLGSVPASPVPPAHPLATPPTPHPPPHTHAYRTRGGQLACAAAGICVAAQPELCVRACRRGCPQQLPRCLGVSTHDCGVAVVHPPAAVASQQGGLGGAAGWACAWLAACTPKAGAAASAQIGQHQGAGAAASCSQHHQAPRQQRPTQQQQQAALT